MGATRSENENGRLYCWEQVSRTNRLFRVSRVFAPRDFADRLLPIYGLFSVVEQSCSALAEEEVAVSKLNWWRNECLHQDWAKSQHPLVKELIRTGVSERLPEKSLASLFDGAEQRLSAGPPSDLDALRSLCIDVYKPQLEIELAVCARSFSINHFAPGLLASNGALQVLRESVHGTGQASFSWVPLNLLARHGISREEIKNRPDSSGVQNLLTELLREFILWGTATGESPGYAAVDYSPARHVFAISGLYARKLQSLAAVSVEQYQDELARLRPADLFEAWRRARGRG